MRARVIQGRFLNHGGPAAGHRPPSTAFGGSALQPTAAGQPVRGHVAPPTTFSRAEAPAAGGVQRQTAAPSIQRQGGGDFAVDPSVLRKIGPGQALPDDVRSHMETALGADFSDVRVHVGPQAASIGALAFTTGSDIYFAPGQYQPGSAAGRHLIGHELAHVVQQRQGRVRGQAGGLTVVTDQALEAEADRNGMLAAQWRPGADSRARAASGSAPAAPSVQRHTGPPAPAARLTARAMPVPPEQSTRTVQRYGGGFSDMTKHDGQIYGIYENEQYPNAIAGSSLADDKCLYVGKTWQQEIGDRFIDHVKLDSWAPWWVDLGLDYSSLDDDKWPYVVRNLQFLKQCTRLDFAAHEQWWIQNMKKAGAALLNDANAIDAQKFQQVSGSAAFTTSGDFSGWSAQDFKKM
ncbi:MAG: DUF4157 domain-containing protein [Pseudomonadota bacterium]